MTERYIPPSEFLQAVINEEVPIGETDFGERNLARLIATTRDPDPANRDWATFLLSQLELDRDEVREALVSAASDEFPAVRAEAILGLAQLNHPLASALLKREFQGTAASMPLFEAAAIMADPDLINDLEAFSAPSDNKFLDELVADAIRACRTKQ